MPGERGRDDGWRRVEEKRRGRDDGWRRVEYGRGAERRVRRDDDETKGKRWTDQLLSSFFRRKTKFRPNNREREGKGRVSYNTHQVIAECWS